MLPLFLFCFCLQSLACGIFVPWLGIKLELCALEAWSLNPWTARECPWHSLNAQIIVVCLKQLKHRSKVGKWSKLTPSREDANGKEGSHQYSGDHNASMSPLSPLHWSFSLTWLQGPELKCRQEVYRLKVPWATDTHLLYHKNWDKTGQQ